MAKVFGVSTIRSVAELARLELSDDEMVLYAHQLSKVLGYIETLNEVDTTGIEPMTNGILDSTVRGLTDEPHTPSGAEAMTANAPESVYNSYKLPQVVGGGQ